MKAEQNREHSMTKSIYDERCPECKGTGWETVPYPDDREQQQRLQAIYGELGNHHPYTIPCRRCNGGHVTKVEIAKNAAKIPNSFYDKKISDFDWNIYRDQEGKEINTSKQKSMVENFIDDFAEWERDDDTKGVGFYIYSSMKGSGKTLLASAICNSLISKYPMQTRFVSASQLLNLAKQSDGSGNYERDPLSLLCNCKLLVLDDLGQKNSGSDWMNDVLFQIVDARYQQKLITIYTSNVPLQSLDFDDRIVDRIYKTSIKLSLPEYCVRAREANEQQRRIFKKYGLM